MEKKSSRTSARPKQLSLDLGQAGMAEGPPPSAWPPIAEPEAAPPRHTDVQTAQTVREGEIVPPLQPHEVASNRATTAFDLYQRAVSHTQNLVLVAAVFAAVLFATKSGATSVEKVSWFGIDVIINDRTKITGVLGMATLLSSLWAMASAYQAHALWKKCGLFYQEILQPPDNVVLKSLRLATRWTVALLVGALVIYSVMSVASDIMVFLFSPGEWVVKVLRSDGTIVP
jgi:hypothetical protein